MMAEKTENELAKIIVNWLLADGWSVFEEISPWGGNGRRADLVARKNSIIWTIETKRHFNLEVLEQAEGWLPYAHFTSIAVWQSERLTGMTEKVCRKFKVGLITVRDWGGFEPKFAVYERVEGFFNRRAATAAISRMLIDETKADGKAGSKALAYETPFKKTCRNLLRIVNENPGIELEEAVRRGKHHYQDDRKAKINLFNKLIAGELPDIAFERHGRKILLYPVNYSRECEITRNVVLAEKRIIPAQIELFG